jgi:4-amino-4-deoxy-L-arabinose transferase-like glycosyltransferase
LIEQQATACRRVNRHWALLALILLAFALRVHNLGQAPLWLDEALSGAIAGKGWQGIIAHSSSTVFEHPPFYYLALHLWSGLAGSSEFSLRFFSLFWGVLLIPLLYRFISPWGGRRLALLTALLSVISTTHVVHSQDARMYTFVLFLGVLSLLFFFRGLQGRRALWWAGYLCVAGVGIVTHYYFALFLLVPIAFLLLAGQRYRRALAFFFPILLGAGLLGAGWLWLSPGPRHTVEQLLRGEGADASSLVLRIRNTTEGLLLEEPAIGPVFLGILALVGVFLWPLPRTMGNHPVKLVGVRRFLLLWLLVPWLAALTVPYWLQGRHLAYLWPALFALAAAGLLALRAKGVGLFLTGLLLVVATVVYGLYHENQLATSRPDYGQVIAYMEDRALPADLVMVNQPVMWSFMDYYLRGDLEVAYVPEKVEEFSGKSVAKQLDSLTQDHSRIWLGPVSAWTADPDSLVERWLVAHTFQAEKSWFPQSTSASLYFTDGGELARIETGRLVWDGRIFLEHVYAGSLKPVPGDAIRLRLDWRAGLDLDRRYAVTLSLVDDRGQVWAERRSEPCGGWCSTSSWVESSLHQDRHALLIPAGTPPGTYHLQVAWSPAKGGSPVPVEEDGARVDQVTLADVEVLPAAGPEPYGSCSDELEATFGEEITLLDYELFPGEARPGDLLHLETAWRAERPPAADYTLLVELVDGRGRPVAGWQLTPVTESYPTNVWRPGEYLRGQHDLEIPNTVSPGSYELRLALIAPGGQRLALAGRESKQVLNGLFSWQASLQGQDLALSTLKVGDRPRQFDLPPVGHALDVMVGRRAHLMGYDLDASRAQPGGQVLLTLYWQAGGPMTKPFRVFTHLVDGEGAVREQHDGPPGGDCCPANTWVDGEIIVDQHPISLGAGLPPGTYRLVVGMYDQDRDTRLPAYAADGEPFAADEVPVGVIAVEPVVTSSQAEAPPPTPRFQMEYRSFLPYAAQDGRRDAPAR